MEIDLFQRTLEPGDKLLLCSDGLWNAFPDPDELAGWIGSAAPPETICREVVHEARQRDGSDNISAVLVHFNSALRGDSTS